MVKLTDTNLDFIKNTGETGSDVANTTFTLPSEMKISPVDSGLWADSGLWFDRKGIPRSATWALNATTFTFWYDEDGDGITDANEQSKTVVLSPDGRIKYEQ
jgi:hypothetical protein